MTRHIPFETKDAPDGEISLDDLQAAIEAHAKATGETITKQAEEIESLKANLLELEQKSADGSLTGHNGGGTTLADELFKNEHVSAVASKAMRDTSVEVKASQLLGLEQKNTITDNSGDFHNVSGSPTGIFQGLERRRFIFDVLPKIAVPTGHVAVTRELSYVNNAQSQASGSPAVYAEGAEKAESTLTFETDDFRLETTAHWLRASNQALADVSQLRSIIDSRLRYGLKTRADADIVSTITAGGNHTAFTPDSGDDGIASVNKAIVKLEEQDAMATHILMAPGTFRSLQRLRTSGGGDGQHIMGQPQGPNREALWNTPVIVTNSMTAGKVIVLDAETIGEYYIRESARVDVGYTNDDFIKNLVTIRAEQRGGLYVVRPVSVVYGDLVL